MELLRRLEDGIEGAMARIFGGVKRPLGSEALASAILKALEKNRIEGLEGSFAPNHYSILVSPADASAMLSLFPTLSAEVRRFVKGLAGERDYRLAGPVVVRWEAARKIERGEATVQAKVVSGQPEAVLSVVRGAQAGTDFLLEGPLVTVGRDAENDVLIADENVSRHHCEIRYAGGEFEVVDLGSTNGVILNGRLVREGVLEDDDRLELGQTLLGFHIRPQRR
jgi:hypothetical protein